MNKHCQLNPTTELVDYSDPTYWRELLGTPQIISRARLAAARRAREMILKARVRDSGLCRTVLNDPPTPLVGFTQRLSIVIALLEDYSTLKD